MKTQEVSIVSFLKELMQRRNRLPSQMAADLGVSHATVLRWLSTEDTPSTESCRRLAEYSGVPLTWILSLAGHLLSIDDISSNLPEFPEYARRKYPNELDEGSITMIEDLIEYRRKRNHRQNSGFGQAKPRRRQEYTPERRNMEGVKK